MPTVFLDLETRSRCDIKKRGGHVYVRDGTTELLCGVIVVVDDAGHSTAIMWSPMPAVDSIPVGAWRVMDEHVEALDLDPQAITWETPVRSCAVPEFLVDLARQGALFVAHNGEGFDRPFLEERGLPETRWLDTMHRARQSGLPAGLDAVGKEVFELGKDQGGSSTLKLLYSPQKKGPKAGEFLEPTSKTLGVVARYCARDVLLMAAAYYTEGWDQPHVDDPVREVHCEIDRRGVPADLVLARRLYDEALAQKAAWLDKAAEWGLDETTLRSSVALPKWLADRGLPVENVQKDTLERALVKIEAGLFEGEDPEPVVDAINARLAFNRVTEGKALAALRKTCPDGRMRGTLVYWGAHTGRWAGRGLQLQNLPSPVAGFGGECYDRDSPAVAADLGVAEEDVLSSMLRGIVVAEPGRYLVLVDYSQIEARVLQWLAGADDKLDVFRSGRDVYMATGADMFGKTYEEVEAEGKKSLERRIGKVATLALGYQGGPNSLKVFAGDLDFAEIGLDPVDVVNLWRDSQPLVAGTRDGLWRTPQGDTVVTRKDGIWRDVKNAVVDLLKGKAQVKRVARCLVYMRGEHLVIELPSGRPLVYRHADYRTWEDNFGGVSNAITFMGVRGRQAKREATYGGRLVENITQAVARDIMADAMIRLEQVGHRPLFTVHDEIVCSVESPDDLKAVEEIMCDTPAWAAGLPVAAEGEISYRYKK